MKIVATVIDYGAALEVGGGVESRSAVIEIPEDRVPALVRKYFEQQQWAKEGPNRYACQTLSFSVLDEAQSPDTKEAEHG